MLVLVAMPGCHTGMLVLKVCRSANITVRRLPNGSRPATCRHRIRLLIQQWEGPAGEFRPGPPPIARCHAARPTLWLLTVLQFGAVMLALWFGGQLVKPSVALLWLKLPVLSGDNLSSPPLAETACWRPAAARGFNRMQEQIRQQLENAADFLAVPSPTICVQYR